MPEQSFWNGREQQRGTKAWEKDRNAAIQILKLRGSALREARTINIKVLNCVYSCFGTHFRADFIRGLTLFAEAFTVDDGDKKLAESRDALDRYADWLDRNVDVVERAANRPEAHKAASLESPTRAPLVANTMKGIRRTKGAAPSQKSPALTPEVRAMVDAADAGLIGLRDRALILLGFAGAFRRSELVRLSVEDCAFGNDGLTITLRRSKTDQQGAGRKVGIPWR
jgi:integrase